MVRDTPMHAVRPMCSCKAARPCTDPPKPWIDLFPRDHDNPMRILSRSERLSQDGRPELSSVAKTHYSVESPMRRLGPGHRRDLDNSRRDKLSQECHLTDHLPLLPHRRPGPSPGLSPGPGRSSLELRNRNQRITGPGCWAGSRARHQFLGASDSSCPPAGMVRSSDSSRGAGIRRNEKKGNRHILSRRMS